MTRRTAALAAARDAEPTKVPAQKPAAMNKTTNKAILTNRNSKLVKMGIQQLTMIMSQPEAWWNLPEDTRQRLLAMLPQPLHGSYDVDEHPLHGRVKEWVADALEHFQVDMAAGLETKRVQSHVVTTTMEDLAVLQTDAQPTGAKLEQIHE